MAVERTEVTIRKRDVYGAQLGLAVISGAKRGKVDLYGTFKYHLSVLRGAVDREIETINTARRELRDEHGKRDAKSNLVTAQLNEKDPNSVQVILENPVVFEQLERELLDGEVTISVSVPKLKLEDILALDFGEQQGDYSGALPFIATGEDALVVLSDAKPRAAKKPARREA